VPLFALSACIGAVTGQNGGAERIDRVREAFRTSFLFALAWGLGVAAVMWVFADVLAAMFLPSEAGQEAAITYWRIASLTIAGYGITIAGSAGFNGLGRPSYGMMITAGRALGLMVPLVLAGAWLVDAPVGVIGGIAAANLLSGLATALFVMTRAPMTAKHGKARKRKPVEDAAEEPA
jgi:Na+-driven multidrug efflux pump